MLSVRPIGAHHVGAVLRGLTCTNLDNSTDMQLMADNAHVNQQQFIDQLFTVSRGSRAICSFSYESKAHILVLTWFRVVKEGIKVTIACSALSDDVHACGVCV